MHFDRCLQSLYGVHAFNADPDCILRISMLPSPVERRLADGFVVHRGAPIVDIHLWNERLPGPRAGERGAHWRKRLMDALRVSLAQLARHLEQYPDVVACRGTTFLRRPERYVPPLAEMGFSLLSPPAETLLERLRKRVDGLYAWLLSRAVMGWSRHAGALERIEMWLPREALMRLSQEE